MMTPAKMALAAALILGTASAALAKGNPNPGGSVRPCSLDGVNPVHHPEIFGNAAAARAFGFVQSPDRSWHVDPRLCESLQRRSI
jgi:hypothetical protein